VHMHMIYKWTKNAELNIQHTLQIQGRP
jgi:hypothetical protein